MHDMGESKENLEGDNLMDKPRTAVTPVTVKNKPSSSTDQRITDMNETKTRDYKSLIACTHDQRRGWSRVTRQKVAKVGNPELLIQNVDAGKEKEATI